MADIDSKYNLEYLERQLQNLSKLVEINGIINSTLDIAKLLSIIMEIIKDIMDTEASTLLLYEEDTRDLVFKVALGEAGTKLEERYRVSFGQGLAGWVAENRKPLIINDVYEDRRFDSRFDHDTGFTTKAMLCAPLLFKGRLLGVIQAINPVNRPKFDENDLALFKAFGNQAALAVQNAIFFRNALEEERIINELHSARSIQDSLHPNLDQEHEGFQIAAKSVSAREVGGEFYDIFFHDRSIKLAIGDIHMKGIPGALHASMVSGAVKALAQVSGKSLGPVLKVLKGFLEENIESLDKSSLFYGVIDSENKNIQFTNLGFAYPILIRNRKARFLKYGRGSFADPIGDVKKVQISLKSGDAFVIVTDGVLNLKNRSGLGFGLKRTMDFLGRDFDSAGSIVTSLLEYANEFTEGLEKREDISILACKVE